MIFLVRMFYIELLKIILSEFTIVICTIIYPFRVIWICLSFNKFDFKSLVDKNWWLLWKGVFWFIVCWFIIISGQLMVKNKQKQEERKEEKPGKVIDTRWNVCVYGWRNRRGWEDHHIDFTGSLSFLSRGVRRHIQISNPPSCPSPLSQTHPLHLPQDPSPSFSSPRLGMGRDEIKRRINSTTLLHPLVFLPRPNIVRPSTPQPQRPLPYIEMR